MSGAASTSPSGSATAQQSWVQNLLSSINAHANVSTDLSDILKSGEFWAPVGLVGAAHWFEWSAGRPRFITFENQFSTVLLRMALVGAAVVVLKKNTSLMDPPVVKEVKAAAEAPKTSTS